MIFRANEIVEQVDQSVREISRIVSRVRYGNEPVFAYIRFLHGREETHLTCLDLSNLDKTSRFSSTMWILLEVTIHHILAEERQRFPTLDEKTFATV